MFFCTTISIAQYPDYALALAVPGQSTVQSTVQSKVQSPGFALTSSYPPSYPPSHFRMVAKECTPTLDPQRVAV